MDFEEALYQANLTPRTAAKYLGVTQQTINRWIKTRAPEIAWRAIALRAGTDPDWRGFRFLDGRVITPAGHTIRAIEIDQIPWFNRLHYSNGQDEAEKRLKEKVAAASQMDEIALNTLKSELIATIEKFHWNVDDYFSPKIRLNIR